MPSQCVTRRSVSYVPHALMTCCQMGFSPEVEDFQPYYVHNKRRFLELRIGESILAEALTRITSTLERDARSKASEKAEQLRAAEQVRILCQLSLKFSLTPSYRSERISKTIESRNSCATKWRKRLEWPKPKQRGDKNLH